MLKKIKYLDLIIAIVTAMVSSFLIIEIIYNYYAIFQLIEKAMRILYPFILSFVIAYILNPVMMFFENKLKIKRWLSLLITYTMLITLIIIIIQLLLPKITSSIIDLFNDIPGYVDNLKKWIDNLVNNNKIIGTITTTEIFKNNINIDKVNSVLISILNSILSRTLSITSLLFNLILGIIISIYVLKDKEKFINIGKKIIYVIFRKKYGKSVVEFIKNIDKVMYIYIGAKSVDSFIIAIISFVALLLLKSQYCILMALIIGITNMIPYFGFIGIIPAIIINVFDSPVKAVWVAILLFSIQQFDALYLNPKLIGHKVGLNPFLIMIAITIGGNLFGALGMLLACPIMAVIKIYATKIIKKHYDKVIE